LYQIRAKTLVIVDINGYLLLAVNITISFFSAFTVMVSKRDIKILTEILDLPEVKVISHRLHNGIGIILLS
jgi:transposase